MNWKEDEHPRDNKGQFTDKNNKLVSIKKINKLYTNEKYVMLPKQEYAELCSAISTKYGNKIPKQGGILYKNNYYVYTYSRRYEQILCRQKLDIEMYFEQIKILEEFLNGSN